MFILLVTDTFLRTPGTKLEIVFILNTVCPMRVALSIMVCIVTVPLYGDVVSLFTVFLNLRM